MIDSGALALYTLQIVAVVAVYHVYGKLNKERKDVEAIKDRNTEVTALLMSMDKRFEAMNSRIDTVDGAPRAVLLRVQEAEAAIGKVDRLLSKLDERVISINARLSVAGRKKKSSEEEVDPASQGEVDEGGSAAIPPGSLPLRNNIPHDFGAPNRRVG